jgi:hypothetical protein
LEGIGNALQHFHRVSFGELLLAAEEQVGTGGTTHGGKLLLQMTF